MVPSQKLWKCLLSECLLPMALNKREADECNVFIYIKKNPVPYNRIKLHSTKIFSLTFEKT